MAAVDDSARRFAKDSFAEDMANHQRMQGKLPTIRENEQLAVPVLEQVEQQLEEERASRPSNVTKQSHVERKAKEKGLHFYRGKDVPVVIRWGDKEQKWYRLASERVRLLLTKRERGPLGQPSWSERVLAATMTTEYHKSFGVPTKMNPGFGELLEVLNESSAVFGDWTKEPERKLYL